MEHCGTRVGNVQRTFLVWYKMVVRDGDCTTVVMDHVGKCGSGGPFVNKL